MSLSLFFHLRRRLVKCCDRQLAAPVPLHTADGTPWDKDHIGRFGEDYAARWLWLEGGCRVLYRNFRASGGGEIDLTLRHGDTLVFAEVKTRTSDAFGRPGAAVDAGKQALIIRGAREWMRLLDWPPITFRFDIIEIRLTTGEPARLTWLPHAFHLPDDERW